MSTPIIIVLVLALLGALFGIVLALADHKFAMASNPLIDEVEEVLPKGQCGACGFAGCRKYAEAVVEDASVPPNLCIPGKDAVAKEVAELTGKKAEATVPHYAYLKCRGTHTAAIAASHYEGVKDCAAAKLVLGGPKGCKFGCIGFGNCAHACPFGALSMGEDGLPIVDQGLCTGCGKCVETCPQHIITLTTFTAPVEVACSSHDKGAVARKLCKNACIGCGICAKNCAHAAITLVNGLATVNTAICEKECESATCTAKCPTKAIQDLIEHHAEANATA